MKNIFCSDSARIFLIAFVGVGLAGWAVAADKKEAHVTQVIRDVRLLAGKSGARPAAVNDSVTEGQAVRTGGDSRAELTFIDRSITRLGANTVFTYGQGAKEFDLSSGAALIVVPKESGTVKINTAAATAAVTGFTALVESHRNAVNKFMVIEGEACVKKKNVSEPCTTLHAGDMLIMQPGTRPTTVERFDIKKTMSTALLVTKFGNLPKWALDDIQTAIDNQGGAGGPGGGPPTDPTGTGTVDQKTNASPTPAATLPPPPGPPPGSPTHRPGRP